jgi:hypothetical protein
MCSAKFRIYNILVVGKICVNFFKDLLKDFLNGVVHIFSINVQGTFRRLKIAFKVIKPSSTRPKMYTVTKKFGLKEIITKKYEDVYIFTGFFCYIPDFFVSVH